MPITHSKVSAKSDGSDASLIRPSDWNAEHVGGFVIEEVVIAFNTPNIATGADLFTVPSGDRLLEIVMYKEAAITTSGGAMEMFADGQGIGETWDLSAAGFPSASVGQAQAIAVKGPAALTIQLTFGTWTAGSVRVGFLVVPSI